MKARPMKVTEKGYSPCNVEEATHVCLHMPGPMPTRILPVIIRGSRRGTSCWTWNGDTEKPTIKPSILSEYVAGSTGETTHRCHSWVNDGKVQFLVDCTHEFAGQTLDLLEVD